MPLSRHLVEILEQQGELVGRYELIDGELIKKMGQNTSHSFTLRLIARWLRQQFTEDYVQSQCPIEVAQLDKATNYVEPDVSVLYISWLELTKRHADPNEVALAVVISDSTLKMDITTKAARLFMHGRELSNTGLSMSMAGRFLCFATRKMGSIRK